MSLDFDSIPFDPNFNIASPFTIMDNSSNRQNIASIIKGLLTEQKFLPSLFNLQQSNNSFVRDDIFKNIISNVYQYKKNFILQNKIVNFLKYQRDNISNIITTNIFEHVLNRHISKKDDNNFNKLYFDKSSNIVNSIYFQYDKKMTFNTYVSNFLDFLSIRYNGLSGFNTHYYNKTLNFNNKKYNYNDVNYKVFYNLSTMSNYRCLLYKKNIIKNFDFNKHYYSVTYDTNVVPMYEHSKFIPKYSIKNFDFNNRNIDISYEYMNSVLRQENKENIYKDFTNNQFDTDYIVSYKSIGNILHNLSYIPKLVQKSNQTLNVPMNITNKADTSTIYGYIRNNKQSNFISSDSIQYQDISFSIYGSNINILNNKPKINKVNDNIQHVYINNDIFSTGNTFHIEKIENNYNKIMFNFKLVKPTITTNIIIPNMHDITMLPTNIDYGRVSSMIFSYDGFMYGRIF